MTARNGKRPTRKARMSEEDRRSSQRWSLTRSPVDPLYVMKVPRVKGRGQGRDVSLGGVGVETAKRLKVGNRVSFSLRLPKGRKMELIEGRVKWIRKNHANFYVGIQFVKLRMVDKLFLIAFLDRSARSQKTLP